MHVAFSCPPSRFPPQSCIYTYTHTHTHIPLLQQHTVEIDGREYTFAGGAGIFVLPPKVAPGAIYRESLVLGATTPSALNKAIELLRQTYTADSYDLLSQNCNHFSNDLVKLLLDKDIPNWVNRLAFMGSFFSCFLPRDMVSDAPVNEQEDYPPPVGQYVGTPAANYKPLVGSNGGGGGSTSARVVVAGGEGETEAERRERVRQATLARMSAPLPSSIGR